MDLQQLSFRSFLDAKSQGVSTFCLCVSMPLQTVEKPHDWAIDGDYFIRAVEEQKYQSSLTASYAPTGALCIFPVL